MKYRVFGILIAVAVVAGTSTRTCHASYSFLADTVQEVYSAESRIPVTQANKIIQTRDGYLWVASYDGLIRYDGNHSKVFSFEEDGFPTRSIMTLFEDSNERLWVGTNTAGLALYDKQSGFRLWDLDTGLPSNSVRAIVEDTRGVIYVATALGLAAVEPDFSVRVVSLTDMESLIVNDMFVSQRGELWCVMHGGEVLVLHQDTLIRRFPPHHFRDGTIVSAFQAADGAVYFGFNDNRVVVLGAGDAYRVYTTGSKRYINAFYEDTLGRIWVCADTGMGFFKHGSFYEVEGALLESSIKSMTVDFEGNRWFASARKGILQVMKSKFRDVSAAASLPSVVVNSTLLWQGQLLIGHDNGLITLDAGGQPVDTELSRILQGTRIRCLVEDNDGSLWICTYSPHGIIRYTAAGEFSSFSKGHGLASDIVRCAIAGRDGRIIVGTAGGISILHNDRVVRSYTKQDGLSNPVIMNVYEDEDGTIYAGSDGGGLYVISGDTVTTYSEAEGLPSGIIMRLKHDPVQGGLWISTENGVCYWDKRGPIQPISKLDSFGVNIFDIQFAGDDGVWLLGSGGIFIVRRQNLFSDAPLEIDVLHERDGLRNPVTANSWHYFSGNNELFLCTNGGVLSITMDAVYKNNTPPKLVISRVTVDDTVYNHPKAISIPRDANRVTVDFSLISYVYPAGNAVTFMLEGFDKRPITMSTDNATQVSYTNLPGGRRSFAISGRNKEGVPSQELRLPVSKNPDWQEIPLVWVLGVSLLFALFLSGSVVYNRRKTKVLLKRQQEYRNITEQAIRAIADTIDAKDRYTSGHSKRVAEYALMIASRLRMSEREQEDLYYSALLHDIGKVGLEDTILNKAGTLTDEEYGKMQQHVTIGGEILKSITVIDGIAIGARYHHERFDGNGYVSHMAGTDIPLFARIICVADAYDAMSTTRSYRSSQPREYILDQLKQGKDTQFDGTVVDIMLELIYNGEAPVEV